MESRNLVSVNLTGVNLIDAKLTYMICDPESEFGVTVGEDPETDCKTRIYKEDKDKYFPNHPDELFDIVSPITIPSDAAVATAL